MIILSGVLVVLAIALLVTGIVTGNTGHEVLGLDGLKLIYVSIGVSIISALCLAIGVFLRRKELFGGAESTASGKRSAAKSAKTARTAKTKARVGAGDDAPVTVIPAATATEVPAETSVYVVPGRKRYHLETCRQLAGRDKEELTFVEAREEGFTACTACLPDTALAARAAFTETSDTGPTEILDTPADVTRTDLPVTKPDTEPTLDEDGEPGAWEVEPSAESPAAEFAGAPEPDASTETEESADTARLDEVPESETASEPATERPLARSRSLFEPLDDEDTATTDTEADAEPATTDAVTDDTATEHDAEDTAAETTTAEPDAAGDHLTGDEADDADDAEDTATGHADAEPEDTDAAEPEHESPAESSAVTTTSDTENESADEADHAGDASEPADTAATDDEPRSADEPDGDDATGDGQDLPYVRILSGTKRYHRPDCALIEDITEDADDLETLSQDEAKDRGCTPCLVCQPDKDPSDR